MLIRLIPLTFMLALNPTVALALGEDQLYTGDASTVAPGGVQFQLYYNTTFSRTFDLAGASIRPGITKNMDARISYGYLWNYRGPNVRIGPSLGLKWRFLGNGKTNTSLSASFLYATNESVGGRPRGSDYGGLLIGQFPTRHAILLVNLGRVWVTEESPDLYYLAFAIARKINPRTLLAIEYIHVGELEASARDIQLTQYVLGAVYHTNPRTGYSLQLGYRPSGGTSMWNTTLGLSCTF